jgi:hypothetical protein
VVLTVSQPDFKTPPPSRRPVVADSQQMTHRLDWDQFVAGARLRELFLMMPVMGNLTLVVAVLSYAGQPNLTAVAPTGTAAPDVEVFAQGVRSALDDLARSVLVPVS